MKEVQINIPALRFPEFEGEWVSRMIGDIGKVITGSTPATSDKKNYDGKYLFVSPADITGSRYIFKTNTTLSEKGFLSGRVVKENSTMFVCIGSTIGKLAQAGVNCVTNQQINSIVPHDGISDNFLFSVLEEAIPRVKLLTAVQAVPIINKSTFSNIKLQIPIYEEQQKIADFLTAVDEKIGGLSKKKDLAEHYKKGVMQKLFSQEIRFTDDHGNPYPDWQENTLGDISEKVTQKNKDILFTDVLTNSAARGIINQRDYFDKDIANQSNLGGYYVVDIDHFVYNPRISTSAPVGPIKRNNLKKGVMSPLYSVFRFTEGNLGMLEYYFQTSFWHRYMKGIANYGVRHDRMNITGGDFLKMPIPFPCKNEQQKIADFLSAIDQKITHISQQITQAQAFKKGLLQQMFV